MSDCEQVGTGWFSWMLCAPNRPPRAAKSSTSGIGNVLMMTGLLSSRMSIIQTSLGWSSALFRTASWVTTIRSRLNRGSAVWQNPGKGGATLMLPTTEGAALSEMSRMNTPESR